MSQYVHTDPITSTHTLSLLPTSPPTHTLSIGTTPTLPPTPQTLRENPAFHGILHAVLAAHAIHDPVVQSSAAAYASQAGASPLVGGSSVLFPPNHPSSQWANNTTNKRSRPSRGPASMGGGTTKYKEAADAGGGGAGGASAQGGMGGAGRGGWVHVSDARNPPDYGRIAWPEDIFGSVEVDGRGQFVGNYQASGTYRVCTREGILGLSPYLREKVVERLRKLEAEESAKGEGR